MIRRAVIDHSLQRRAVLAAVKAGRTSLADVCDAHPHLLQASRFHGEDTGRPCPLCARTDVRVVHFVYGDRLASKAVTISAGQAKTSREIEMLAERLREFHVYVVEVCPSCRWNHLLTSFVTGTSANAVAVSVEVSDPPPGKGDPPARRRRRAPAD